MAAEGLERSCAKSGANGTVHACLRPVYMDYADSPSKLCTNTEQCAPQWHTRRLAERWHGTVKRRHIRAVTGNAVRATEPHAASLRRPGLPPAARHAGHNGSPHSRQNSDSLLPVKNRPEILSNLVTAPKHIQVMPECSSSCQCWLADCVKETCRTYDEHSMHVPGICARPIWPQRPMNGPAIGLRRQHLKQSIQRSAPKGAARSLNARIALGRQTSGQRRSPANTSLQR